VGDTGIEPVTSSV